MIAKNVFAALKMNQPVIVTDDDDREAEGDLVLDAEHITPELMNFTIRHTSGIVCLALTRERVQQLALPMMVNPQTNSSKHGTPFTVSIDAREGISTGVSAADRVRTVQVACNPASLPTDLVMPGHVFPLQAEDGGVLVRRGHTEGSVDLLHAAGLAKNAVICELMNADGTMMRGEQLKAFAAHHAIPVVSIADIVQHRYESEALFEEVVSTAIPLAAYGTFEVFVFKEKWTGHEIIVAANLQKNNTAQIAKITQATKGSSASQSLPLVRIHSCCFTGDVLGSQMCDCGPQLDFSLRQIAEQGGLLIYLPQEGRGIGMLHKIKAYNLQQQGYDTVSANEALGFPIDLRRYDQVILILRYFNLHEFRLLTNNPEKIAVMQQYQLSVQPVSLPKFATAYNAAYLNTKQTRLGHRFANLEIFYEPTKNKQ